MRSTRTRVAGLAALAGVVRGVTPEVGGGEDPTATPFPTDDADDDDDDDDDDEDACLCVFMCARVCVCVCVCVCAWLRWIDYLLTHCEMKICACRGGGERRGKRGLCVCVCACVCVCVRACVRTCVFEYVSCKNDDDNGRRCPHACLCF